MDLPSQSHLAQWGTQLNGEIKFTVDGVTRVMKHGDHWGLPSGMELGAVIRAGSKAIDVFEKPDLYRVKS